MVALQTKWGIAKIRLHSLWVITVWERNYMSVHLTRKLCWYNKRLVGQIFPRNLLQLLPERRGWSQMPKGHLEDPVAGPRSVYREQREVQSSAVQHLHCCSCSPIWVGPEDSWTTADLEVLIHIAFSQQSAPAHIGKIRFTEARRMVSSAKSRCHLYVTDLNPLQLLPAPQNQMLQKENTTNPPPTKCLCWLLLPARQGHNAHLEHRGTKWLPPAMLAVYTPTGCVRLYCQNLFQIHKSTCRHSNNSVSPFIQQDRIYEGIRQI